MGGVSVAKLFTLASLNKGHVIHNKVQVSSLAHEKALLANDCEGSAGVVDVHVAV